MSDHWLNSDKVISANLSLYVEVDMLEGCVCSWLEKGRKEKEEFLTTLLQWELSAGMDKLNQSSKEHCGIHFNRQSCAFSHVSLVGGNAHLGCVLIEAGILLGCAVDLGTWKCSFFPGFRHWSPTSLLFGSSLGKDVPFLNLASGFLPTYLLKKNIGWIGRCRQALASSLFSGPAGCAWALVWKSDFHVNILWHLNVNTLPTDFFGLVLKLHACSCNFWAIHAVCAHRAQQAQVQLFLLM